jgi:hypothetical protein
MVGGVQAGYLIGHFVVLSSLDLQIASDMWGRFPHLAFKAK